MINKKILQSISGPHKVRLFEKIVRSAKNNFFSADECWVKKSINLETRSQKTFLELICESKGNKLIFNKS